MTEFLVRNQRQSNLHLPRLDSVEDCDLAGLQKQVSAAPIADSYVRSAAYLAVTGRKGLWKYGAAPNQLVLARHPNRSHILLCFPPLTRDAYQLLPVLLTDQRMAKERIQFSRYSQGEIHQLSHIFPMVDQWRQEENVLDWRFPAHTLDVSLVTRHEGSDFRNFRHKVRQAIRSGIRVKPINLQVDGHLILCAAKDWMGAHHSGQGDELLEPVRRVLSLARKAAVRVFGVTVTKGSMIVGYSIWEESEPERGIANGLVKATRPGFNGSSELAYLGACQSLLKRGYKQFCIGGSETQELDAFKRKMHPTRSLELFTLVPS